MPAAGAAAAGAEVSQHAADPLVVGATGIVTTGAVPAEKAAGTAEKTAVARTGSRAETAPESHDATDAVDVALAPPPATTAALTAAASKLMTSATALVCRRRAVAVADTTVKPLVGRLSAPAMAAPSAATAGAVASDAAVMTPEAAARRSVT